MEILAFVLAFLVAQPPDPPQMAAVEVKSFYTAPWVTMTLSGINAGETVAVEVNDDAAKPWVRIKPCRLPETWASPQAFKNPDVTLTMTTDGDAEKGWACRIDIATPKAVAALRAEVQDGQISVHVMPDLNYAHLWDLNRRWAAENKGNAAQPELRSLMVMLAGYDDNPYAQDTLAQIFKEGSFAQVLAGAFGVCANYRYEYGETLRNLKLLDQLAGTPETFWLQKCQNRLQMLSDLDRQMQDPQSNPDLVHSPFFSTLVVRRGKAGELLARAFNRALARLPADAKEARMMQFLLVLREAQRRNWQDELTGLDRVLMGRDVFDLRLQTFDGLSPLEEEVQVTLRINRTNLTFFKAELLRDRMKDYADALKLYRGLSQLPPSEKVFSIHPTENAYAKPAAIAAKSEMAYTYLTSGYLLKACSLWADLAWQEPNALLEGNEDQQTYCRHSLRQIEKHCGAEWGAVVIRQRQEKFDQTPLDCRQAAQALIQNAARP